MNYQKHTQNMPFQGKSKTADFIHGKIQYILSVKFLKPRTIIQIKYLIL